MVKGEKEEGATIIGQNSPPKINIITKQTSNPKPRAFQSFGENRNYNYNGARGRNEPQTGAILLYISAFWNSAALVVFRAQKL